jgi:hypothetical protein
LSHHLIEIPAAAPNGLAFGTARFPVVHSS